MSKYTTGELAKRCDISVRTVQFYDTKGLLHPSELTGGGRRLYSDADLKRMQLICLLKSLGLSLGSIKGILQSEQPQKVLLLLLDEQEKQLEVEIEEKTKQSRTITAVRQCIEKAQVFPDNLCNDIENVMMENEQKKLRKVHMKMLFWGVPITLVENAAILLWIFKGIWLPFVIVMPIAIVIVVLFVRMYYRNTAYICPECNTAFKPDFWEFFFAGHNPKARKLTCKYCEKKHWCVETYDSGNS